MNSGQIGKELLSLYEEVFHNGGLSDERKEQLTTILDELDSEEVANVFKSLQRLETSNEDECSSSLFEQVNEDLVNHEEDSLHELLDY